MEKVIIFGASGHANVIIDILEKQKKYEIEGIFVDTPDMIGTEIMGYPVLDKIVNFYGASKGIIAIGDNYGRMTVKNKILETNPDFEFINAIHPSASIGKNVSIDQGTVVVAGAVVNANAKIGKHCIINTQSSVGHDVVVGDFSTMAPGSHIGGNTTIGTNTTVSMGANVIQKLYVGNNTVIGAGSTVIHSIHDNVVAYGTPAKIIRDREPNEKYV